MKITKKYWKYSSRGRAVGWGGEDPMLATWTWTEPEHTQNPWKGGPDPLPILLIFIPWLFHFATLCLCWMHGFASHLFCLSLSKP